MLNPLFPMNLPKSFYCPNPKKIRGVLQAGHERVIYAHQKMIRCNNCGCHLTHDKEIGYMSKYVITEEQELELW